MQTYSTIRNIFLMEADIFCKLSNRQPQEFAVKTKPSSVPPSNGRSRPKELKKRNTLSPSACWLSAVDCTFVGDDLVYVPEVQWRHRGIVVFTKRNMVVKLDNKSLTRIPLNTIVKLVWFRDGSLTLTFLLRCHPNREIDGRVIWNQSEWQQQ